MEKDPVCGMLVDPARAVGQRTAGGKTYYFCNAGCLAKFDAKPERYVSQDAKGKT
jgi:Cu+-exporting ATPase